MINIKNSIYIKIVKLNCSFSKNIFIFFREEISLNIVDSKAKDFSIKNKKLDYKLITFFILPPSKEVLYKRLTNRDMKDKIIVEERMKQFERDVLHWINYDYVVVNDDLQNCYSKIHNLINAEISNGSKDYDLEFIRNHVEKLTN